MRKHEREFIRLVQIEGLMVHNVEHRGRHFAIYTDRGMIITSCTPSDRRCYVNTRAIARRMARS